MTDRTTPDAPRPVLVLVPLEPTPEMIRAAKWALFRWRESKGDPQMEAPPDEKHAIRWRAMVEAYLRENL